MLDRRLRLTLIGRQVAAELARLRRLMRNAGRATSPPPIDIDGS